MGVISVEVDESVKERSTLVGRVCSTVVSPETVVPSLIILENQSGTHLVRTLEV